MEMDHLLKLLAQDMKPALGVTEPGAIAFAVATARKRAEGPIRTVTVRTNSGIYKNAFTCGIPGSDHTGAVWAAALGASGGDPALGLETLDAVTDADRAEAERLVAEGRVTVLLREISSEIFLEATVETEAHTCTVCIEHTHLGIRRILLDGETVLERAAESAGAAAGDTVHGCSFAELYELAATAPVGDLAFLREAHAVNLRLFEVGLASERTVFTRRFFEKNGGIRVSGDALATAQLLCCGALEARVLGLDAPAMSLTGSGAHGILATLPLYAEAKVRDLPEEALLRATALSALVTTYIKEYSGRLSAFCGCAIAAGTGAACGLTMLRGGDAGAAERAIRNMASSVTGMICDGGNHGCVMKGVVAVDAAFRSADLALCGAAIGAEHGINGATAEETMEFMGKIADPGMVQTEGTILDILRRKSE